MLQITWSFFVRTVLCLALNSDALPNKTQVLFCLLTVTRVFRHTERFLEWANASSNYSNRRIYVNGAAHVSLRDPVPKELWRRRPRLGNHSNRRRCSSSAGRAFFAPCPVLSATDMASKRRFAGLGGITGPLFPVGNAAGRMALMSTINFVRERRRTLEMNITYILIYQFDRGRIRQLIITNAFDLRRYTWNKIFEHLDCFHVLWRL